MERHSGTGTTKLLALAAALLATASHAQEPVVCGGDDAVAGTVHGIVEAGTRVFALTSASGNHPDGGGLYISCTGGDAWYKHPGVPDGGVPLVADPGDADTLYAGIGGGFVYVSRDAGETWTSSRPVEFGTIHVSALAALPGGQVFAGMGNGELLQSNDYGLSWTSLGMSLPDAEVHTILVDPGDANRILVAVGDDGVYQSLDGGQSFQKSTLAGVFIQPTFWPVRDIAFAPSNASQVYAGDSSGLWESVDGGQTFSGLGGDGDIVDITFGRRDTTTMFIVSEFAGVQRSTDGGQSFTLLAPDLPDGSDWFRRVLQMANGRLLVGTVVEGIYKSDDDGVTWSSAGTPPPSPPPPPPEPTVTANLTVSIDNLNGAEPIEHGSQAVFRITVRNDGPNVSTETFVQVDWTQPGTNDAPNYAFTLSSSTGSCTVAPDGAAGCSFGTLGVGASAMIEFRGTTSTDYIGTHKISATGRNAESAVVIANGSVATKNTIACFGDCGDSPAGGGGSTDVLSLGALVLLVFGFRGARRRRDAAA
jgi:photosystem II stability/assembly factor-like uncharacterized protein